MPKISSIHWKKFEKFLLFVGCELIREKGDHRVYWRADLKRPVIIPRDTQLPIFVIRNNIRLLGMTHKEYLEVLKRI